MLILKCNGCGRTFDTNKGREPGFDCDKCNGVVLVDMDDESRDDSIERMARMKRLLKGAPL